MVHLERKNSKVVDDGVLYFSAFLSLIIASSAFTHAKGDSWSSWVSVPSLSRDGAAVLEFIEDVEEQ